MTGNELGGLRIGVFGKGGAGKSTLTVLLAQALEGEGYPVVVIDADSTNFGLAQALGLEPPKKTLLDWFGGMVFSGGDVTCPVDDPTLLEDSEVYLGDLPAEFYSQNGSNLILFTAGKIGGLGPGAGCDGPVAKIARDFKIVMNGQAPVTLIDFKAGFEDSARGALTQLDYAIVVIDPTVASLELAGEMRNMIEQIKKDVLPATAHLESPELVELANKLYLESAVQGMVCVLNRIPDHGAEELLREKLSQKGLKPVGCIWDDSGIQSSWLKGEIIQAASAVKEARKIILALKNKRNT